MPSVSPLQPPALGRASFNSPLSSHPCSEICAPGPIGDEKELLISYVLGPYRAIFSPPQSSAVDVRHEN